MHAREYMYMPRNARFWFSIYKSNLISWLELASVRKCALLHSWCELTDFGFTASDSSVLFKGVM